MISKNQKTPRIVLGLQGVTTRLKKPIPLKDGGASLFIDGNLVFSISEERLNRTKHSTGFKLAAEYCLESAGLDKKQIDLIALGNCCDLPLDEQSASLALNYPNTPIHIVRSHHRSHALLAALQSGFDSALVVIADNEGNLFEPLIDIDNYWNNYAERISYYAYTSGDLTLIGHDCITADNIGFGDAYHYFTHFLGWHSYTHAGRVMGLSAYGDKTRFSHIPIWSLDNNGKVITHLKNRRKNKLDAITALANQHLQEKIHPRLPDEKIDKMHMDIAAWVQGNLESILTKKIEMLIKKTGLRNVCLGGGLAYNCLANCTVLQNPKVERVFISYAPGDEGQPIGNAIDALWKYRNTLPINPGDSPFLGKEYSDNDIKQAISSLGKGYTIIKCDYIEITAAKYIELGAVIGWFQGRSEMGSRALGNRSILADPRNTLTKERINHVKNREWFRPVAPSVIAEKQNLFFNSDYYIPYMNIATSVLDKSRDLIPAVTHIDGSSRIQSVRKEDNSRFYKLLRAFEELTGVPILANTSFNSNHQPIVESPVDAVRAFKEMNLDALCLDNYIIVKSRWLNDNKTIDNGSCNKRVRIPQHS